MQFNRSHLRSLTASLFAILLLSVAAAAKGEHSLAFPNVHIKNFGQMDERFYRGAEPKDQADVQSLKDLGVKTVIDLKNDPNPSEREWVESLGMRYVNIPMSDKSYPQAESVATFLKTVDDPSTGKFFVHCAGGRHRTGAMGAVYRYEKYGWNFDQVYAEMKQYDFYTTWGHGDIKTFVEDYGRQMQARAASAKTTPVASASAPVVKTAAKSSAETVLTGNQK
jgi:tyrosine-protein phosphatase SIW14